MKITMRIVRAGAVVVALSLVSCGGGGGGGGTTVNSQANAEHLAWAVEGSVTGAAPFSTDATWSGTVVHGAVSGTATVTGSFVSTYDAYSGVATDTYDNVVIVFSNFSDVASYPSLSGTVTLGGTCTTYYGSTTTYSGSWDAVGNSLSLGGPYTGQASIAIEWRRAGLDWGAIVTAGSQSWTVTN